ncbi:MAG: extracellular solute-binding protein, partial [Pseudomonadota bacterium]|nr:extracellular solute-binding protein [Pseudomonadota bacterium]
MKTMIMRRLMAGAAALSMPIAAHAADLEVTHWWTSGGEANAVQELAKAFEAKTDHKWVDGAIAGSGNTARPVIISRIIGGDPMAATQLNHGKQAQELIEAGLMLDLTDIAEEGKWAEIVQPKSLLDACTVDGRVYCVPLNIHSIQWLWTSNAAFEKAGIDPVNNWEELKAAAPKLREAGILPLAMGAQGWQEAYLVHNFLSGTSEDLYYAVYRDNEKRPLASKTVQDAYPPGSTFKMITALAALEAGVITPSETVYCPGHLEVGGRKFHCWKRAGHGHMNLEQSLRESCDVYYYDLALKVGIEKIADMARRLGLGETFDFPMSAVTSGLVPDKAWKLRERDSEWVIGDTVNASIGQGFVLSSPLQQAVMTARIATGRAVEPRLIKSVDSVELPSKGGASLGINENDLKQVRKAMYAVSNNRRGTAYKSRIIDDTVRMAGKTGTSQVRNITAAERARGVTRNEDLPWERRDHALFVDFAPYDKPKIAVAVVVEHGGGGSTAAAPIARDVTLQALFKGTPP